MSTSRYIKKIKKIKKTKIILLFIIIILVIFKCYISISTALMNEDIILNKNDKLIDFSEDFSIYKVLSYGINDYNNATELSKYKISVADGNTCVYNQICQLKIEIEDFSQSNTYMIKYGDEEKVLKDKETLIDYSLSEGSNTLNVQLYINDILEEEKNIQVYYIEPYKKQFLDELAEESISTHYRTGKYENYDSSVELLENLGVNYIRTDFFWGYIYLNGRYDFSKYDNWINSMKEDTPNVKILGILNSSASIVGEDRKINTEEELNDFIEFCSNVAKHYPDILNYQILNEPNSVYVTDEDIRWYNRIIEEVSKELKSINPEIKITQYSLSAGTNDSSTYLSSKTFYDRSLNNSIYMLSDSISYNVYYDLENKIQTHKKQFNDFGGFIKQEITEYGISSTNGITEEEQARQIIIQTIQIDSFNINRKNLYNLWNTGTDSTQSTHNFGLLHNDYTPKLSYYALKNYYENTNGAEYIGTVNLADGLEAHVYDKDGKPKIIAWSTNTENSIELPYENFTASDIYGNEIENTNGTLEITTSPVYLDNISDAYFYEAISNTALEKYAEFEKKFEAEIANINGLQEEINTLKQYMSSIANNTTEDENVAIEQMNTHFNLGNVILSAYKNGSLDVEYVKLSSMLDMLNDIGNSYEDLLTVCATTRAPYYTATEELINSAENKINNNSDLEIVYPSKILDFAKELNEKSEYINSLSEENDIKTGLIVSNSLHAYYLADWANEFASIYIDEYIEANPVTVSYSNSTEWTNEDVVATLNIGNDATVTNNGGSNTYTFRSNGSFTFEYERRGQAFTLEAKVSNIDKTYPTITGVKDGQTYTSSVKPVIEDTNLSIVSISYNGEDIEYYDGITLEDEGIYSIVATDRAGNTTTVEFNIISEVQDNYIIQDNYLLNVWQETTLTDFKNNFTSQGESYTIKRNDTELTDTDIIATGDTIELSSGDTYTIVVAGDINCDGRVTVFDFSALRRYILKQIEFTEIELLAADINIDSNDVGVKDYSRMRIEILGRY